MELHRREPTESFHRNDQAEEHVPKAAAAPPDGIAATSGSMIPLCCGMALMKPSPEPRPFLQTQSAAASLQGLIRVRRRAIFAPPIPAPRPNQRSGSRSWRHPERPRAAGSTMQEPPKPPCSGGGAFGNEPVQRPPAGEPGGRPENSKFVRFGQVQQSGRIASYGTERNDLPFAAWASRASTMSISAALSCRPAKILRSRWLSVFASSRLLK